MFAQSPINIKAGPESTHQSLSSHPAKLAIHLFSFIQFMGSMRKKSTNSNIHAKQHGWRNLHCRQLYSIRHGCHSCPHTVVLPNNDCMYIEGNSAPLKGRCHCSSTNYPTAKSTTFCLAGWQILAGPYVAQILAESSKLFFSFSLWNE